MPFTLVHTGKYRTEDKLKLQTINKLSTTQKKQTMQNTAKQNYSGLVTSYNTQPGNEVRLFYNAPEPTHGLLPKAVSKREPLQTIKDCFADGEACGATMKWT